jgi:hypothetical protein
MQLARIEGLPPDVKPLALSASLTRHITASEPLGSTSNLQPAGEHPTLAEAEADPRMVAHLSPPSDPPTEGEREEARRKLGVAEKLCRPGEPRLIAFWCARLRGLTGAPESQTGSQGAIAAICLACADLPGVVWTNENLALALRTFTRWPAPAQVYALMAEQAKPFLRTRDGLRRVLDTAPAQPVEQAMPPTPEALDHVRQVVSAFVVERGYRRNQPLPPAQERSVSSPQPMAPATLLAAYEKLAAQGQPGAALRLEMLRRSMAATQEATR